VSRCVFWGRFAAVLAGTASCAACAMPVSKLPAIPAQVLAIEERNEQVAQIQAYYAQLARVDNVAFRIRTANRQFCKTVAAQIGLHAATVRSLPNKYRSYTNQALNVSWTKPTVIAAVDNSPASLAGIKIGDEVLRLNGQAIPARRTQHWIDNYLANNGMTPVKVDLSRDGVERMVTVSPVMACAIPIRYVTTDQVNAYTTGDKIVINSAIVALAKTDDQLAVVIGHELAHANLGHIEKREQNAVLGELGGALVDGGFLLGGIYTRGTFTRHFGRAGAMAYSVEFEREADYVGAYYAARAGYDLNGAAEIWRAMGQSHPNTIRFASDHPTSPLRFIQMREVAAEIADKKRRHLPLIPELKPPTAQTAPAPSDYNY
jgi:Zn-dependent protease with chaperone function